MYNQKRFVRHGEETFETVVCGAKKLTFSPSLLFLPQATQSSPFPSWNTPGDPRSKMCYSDRPSSAVADGSFFVCEPRGGPYDMRWLSWASDELYDLAGSHTPQSFGEETWPVDVSRFLSKENQGAVLRSHSGGISSNPIPSPIHGNPLERKRMCEEEEEGGTAPRNEIDGKTVAKCLLPRDEKQYAVTQLMRTLGPLDFRYHLYMSKPLDNLVYGTTCMYDVSMRARVRMGTNPRSERASRCTYVPGQGDFVELDVLSHDVHIFFCGKRQELDDDREDSILSPAHQSPPPKGDVLKEKMLTESAPPREKEESGFPPNSMPTGSRATLYILVPSKLCCGPTGDAELAEENGGSDGYMVFEIPLSDKVTLRTLHMHIPRRIRNAGAVPFSLRPRPVGKKSAGAQRERAQRDTRVAYDPRLSPHIAEDPNKDAAKTSAAFLGDTGRPDLCHRTNRKKVMQMRQACSMIESVSVTSRSDSEQEEEEAEDGNSASTTSSSNHSGASSSQRANNNVEPDMIDHNKAELFTPPQTRNSGKKSEENTVVPEATSKLYASNIMMESAVHALSVDRDPEAAKQATQVWGEDSFVSSTLFHNVTDQFSRVAVPFYQYRTDGRVLRSFSERYMRCPCNDQGLFHLIDRDFSPEDDPSSPQPRKIPPDATILGTDREPAGDGSPGPKQEREASGSAHQVVDAFETYDIKVAPPQEALDQADGSEEKPLPVMDFQDEQMLSTFYNQYLFCGRTYRAGFVFKRGSRLAFMTHSEERSDLDQLRMFLLSNLDRFEKTMLKPSVAGKLPCQVSVNTILNSLHEHMRIRPYLRGVYTMCDIPKQVFSNVASMLPNAWGAVPESVSGSHRSEQLPVTISCYPVPSGRPRRTEMYKSEQFGRLFAQYCRAFNVMDVAGNGVCVVFVVDRYRRLVSVHPSNSLTNIKDFRKIVTHISEGTNYIQKTSREARIRRGGGRNTPKGVSESMFGRTQARRSTKLTYVKKQLFCSYCLIFEGNALWRERAVYIGRRLGIKRPGSKEGPLQTDDFNKVLDSPVVREAHTKWLTRRAHSKGPRNTHKDRKMDHRHRSLSLFRQNPGASISSIMPFPYDVLAVFSSVEPPRKSVPPSSAIHTQDGPFVDLHAPTDSVSEEAAELAESEFSVLHRDPRELWTSSQITIMPHAHVYASNEHGCHDEEVRDEQLRPPSSKRSRKPPTDSAPTGRRGEEQPYRAVSRGGHRTENSFGKAHSQESGYSGCDMLDDTEDLFGHTEKGKETTDCADMLDDTEDLFV